MNRRAFWGLTLASALVVVLLSGGCKKPTQVISSGKNDNVEIQRNVNNKSRKRVAIKSTRKSDYAGRGYVTSETSINETQIPEEGSYFLMYPGDIPNAMDRLTNNSRHAVAIVNGSGNLEGTIEGYSGGDVFLGDGKDFRNRGKIYRIRVNGENFFSDPDVVVPQDTYTFNVTSGSFPQYTVKPETIVFGSGSDIAEYNSSGIRVMGADKNVRVRTLDCLFQGNVRAEYRGAFTDEFRGFIDRITQHSKLRFVDSKGEKTELEINNGQFEGALAKGEYDAKLVYEFDTDKSGIAGEIKLPRVSVKGNSRGELVWVVDKRQVGVSLRFEEARETRAFLLSADEHVMGYEAQVDSFYYSGENPRVIPGMYAVQANLKRQHGGWYFSDGGVIPVISGEEKVFVGSGETPRKLESLGDWKGQNPKEELLKALEDSHFLNPDKTWLGYNSSYPTSFRNKINVAKKPVEYDLNVLSKNNLRLTWTYDRKTGFKDISNFGWIIYTQGGEAYHEKDDVEIGDGLGIGWDIYQYFDNKPDMSRLDTSSCDFCVVVGVSKSGVGGIRVNLLRFPNSSQLKIEKIPGVIR